MASISATVRHPFFICIAQDLKIDSIYGKSVGITFFVCCSFQLNLQFDPNPKSRGVDAWLGGFRLIFYFL